MAANPIPEAVRAIRDVLFRVYMDHYDFKVATALLHDMAVAVSSLTVAHQQGHPASEYVGATAKARDCTCQRYDGRDCRKCFRPPYPDQTQQQGGGEATICPNCERPTEIRHCQACGADFINSAPPSAPVGVEDVEVLKRLRAALPDVGLNGWWLGVEVLDRVIDTLAQQPAAVGLSSEEREAFEAWKKERAARAQQPAAVDEATVERAWVAFCENTGSARQGIRAALTAAFATHHIRNKDAI
jgi:hypothetical protein